MNSLCKLTILLASISLVVGYIVLKYSDTWGMAYCLVIPFLYLVVGIITSSYNKNWGHAFLISSGVIALIGFAVCSGSINLGPH